MRVELPNPQGLLKPAMYAEADLATGHARGRALAVPESAVLDSGTRQALLVQRAPGLFEPREVSQGDESTATYLTTLKPTDSLEDLSAQLMADGKKGIKNVSWSPPKRG